MIKTCTSKIFILSTIVDTQPKTIIYFEGCKVFEYLDIECCTMVVRIWEYCVGNQKHCGISFLFS